jgi:pimeloyl-ACP methyl ester carboxylesterase
MVYYPYKQIISTPADEGLNYRDVNFHASDGVSLSGWMVGNEKKNFVILFCHGNGGNISYNIGFLPIFDRLDCRTFIFDYRGYGQSGGKPTEEGTYLDVEAAWKYLVEIEKIQPGRIILFGHSLGGAIATHLAVKTGNKAKALILESTFTSVPELGSGLYPYLPVALVCKYKYDTRKLLPKISIPLLIIHSPQDEIIPYKHGQTLFSEAHEPKQFLIISGTHNEGSFSSGTLYISGLMKFLGR